VSAHHLSDLELDWLVLGGDELAARRGGAHLAACASCRARAETLRESRDHFTARVLPRTLPALRARTRAPGWWRRTWLVAPALAAAAALVLMLRVGDRPPPDDDLRAKGGPSLQIVARRGDQTFRVVDGATLAAGDAVRFVVAAPRDGHLMIASIDGRGVASLYHPAGGDRSAPLPAGARVELPGSIVLDDAPGPERFVALWSAASLPAAPVLAALTAIGAGGPDAIRAAPPLAVGADAERSLVIEKATARP
jgi:hypothetical protein